MFPYPLSSGSLNVLSTVVKKPTEQIFYEFGGSGSQETEGSGDVKYHLGYSTNKPAGNKPYSPPSTSHWVCVYVCVARVGKERLPFSRQQPSGKCLCSRVHNRSIPSKSPRLTL